MRFEVDRVKGFQDFLPPESLKRKEIKKIVETVFNEYGFIPIETPLVEYDETMKSDTLPAEEEDEAISDRFRLKDKGGRNLGLRYEFTFQLARILKQNPTLKMPFKRYQIGEVFRDEPVSSTRFRQFTQCDIDIIGEPSVYSDAECLSLAAEIMKKLDIDYEIKINNRKLLTSIIESVQFQNSKGVMKELDKIEKLGEDEVKISLRKYGSANQILTLFKLLEKGLDFYKENAFEGAEEIENLMRLSRLYNLKITFDPFLARGLGYYTGNIFEVKVEGKRDTIAAGGRYDKTVGKYLNRDVPAVGISFGLERISQLSKLIPKSPIRALIISLGQDKTSIKLSNNIRKKGISCSTWFSKIGKGFDYANSQNIPYVITIGDEEIKSKKYKLKNMSSGEEKSLTEKQVISQISK